MMVVISIIAILTLIGVTSMFSARDQYYADQASEIAISAIREAQNRSISFTQGTPGEGNVTTKVWGVSFNADPTNTIELISVDSSGFNHPEGTKDINAAVSINPTGGDHIYFASPFGTPYVTSSACTVWDQSETKPSKEFEPECTYLVDDQEAYIEFEYKGNIYTVTINSKGVANVN